MFAKKNPQTPLRSETGEQVYRTGSDCPRLSKLFPYLVATRQDGTREIATPPWLKCIKTFDDAIREAEREFRNADVKELELENWSSPVKIKFARRNENESDEMGDATKSSAENN